MPQATESNAGMICQYRGTGTLLDRYQDGYFYQVAEDTRMRDFDLQSNPNKYSSLYISDWMALEDFMASELDDVTFYWASTMSGNGWLIRGSMLDNPTADLSQYGISYTLESGQTIEVGDEITIHILKSYYWKNIQVQPENFIVDVLPNANMENWGRVVFLAGSDMLAPLPEYPVGKWSRCEDFYDEDLEALRAQLELTAEYLKERFLKKDRFYMSAIGSKISDCIRGKNPAERCHLGVRQMPVTPSGDLYPCTSFIGDERYLLGNVFDGIDEKKVIELATP